MIVELCGEELDGAICDRLRGHESPWHEGLDADGNWHSWTHGYPGETLPDAFPGGSLPSPRRVFVNPRGQHASVDPCNAPGEICPCRIP